MENEESNIETTRTQGPFYYFSMFLAAIGLMYLFSSLLAAFGLVIANYERLANEKPTQELMTELLTNGSVKSLKLVQLFSSIGGFWLSSFVFFKIFKINMVSDLGLNASVKTKHWLLIIPIFIFILPVISGLQIINSYIDVSSIFPQMQKSFEQMQTMNNEMMEKFLVMPDAGSLFFNVFLIALIPAVGEELMFRGILFPLFWGWYKNKHVAIVISAVLFSLIHMQFFNFLPIILMGILFGYLYVWSGSIWVTMLLHFLNNATVVIATYFYQKNGADWLSPSYEIPWYFALISLPFCAYFVYQFYKSRINE